MTDNQPTFLTIFIIWNIVGILCVGNIPTYDCMNNKQKLFVCLFCGPLAFIVQVCICIYEWLGNKES